MLVLVVVIVLVYFGRPSLFRPATIKIVVDEDDDEHERTATRLKRPALKMRGTTIVVIIPPGY